MTADHSLEGAGKDFGNAFRYINVLKILEDRTSDLPREPGEILADEISVLEAVLNAHVFLEYKINLFEGIYDTDNAASCLEQYGDVTVWRRLHERRYQSQSSISQTMMYLAALKAIKKEYEENRSGMRVPEEMRTELISFYTAMADKVSGKCLDHFGK